MCAGGLKVFACQLYLIPLLLQTYIYLFILRSGCPLLVVPLMSCFHCLHTFLSPAPLAHGPMPLPAPAPLAHGLMPLPAPAPLTFPLQRSSAWWRSCGSTTSHWTRWHHSGQKRCGAQVGDEGDDADDNDDDGGCDDAAAAADDDN